MNRKHSAVHIRTRHVRGKTKNSSPGQLRDLCSSHNKCVQKASGFAGTGARHVATMIAPIPAWREINSLLASGGMHLVSIPQSCISAMSSAFGVVCARHCGGSRTHVALSLSQAPLGMPAGCEGAQRSVSLWLAISSIA